MVPCDTLKTLPLLLLLATGSAFADIRPLKPNPPPRGPIAGKKVEAPVHVWKNVRQKTTRIQIPANILAKLQADPQGKVSQASPSKNNATRTIIAGLSLAMAGACGFVLLGRKVPRSANVAALTFLALSLTVTGGAIADLLPSPFDRPKPRVQGLLLSKTSDKVIIEITDKGKAIEVILGNDARWVK